jgi:hypothetical protein
VYDLPSILSSDTVFISSSGPGIFCDSVSYTVNNASSYPGLEWPERDSNHMLLSAEEARAAVRDNSDSISSFNL